MSTAISGRIALLRFSTSTPDMSERERSTSATSKGEARTCAMASSPVRASPATSMSTRPEKTCFSPIRSTSWSSTINSRIIVCWPAGLVMVITSRRPRRGIVGNNGFECRINPTLSGSERVAQNETVLFHGNIFPLQSRQLGHEFTRRLVHDAPRARVVAQRALRAARRVALVLAGVAARHEVEVRLRRGRVHEGGGVLRHPGHEPRLGLELQRLRLCRGSPLPCRGCDTRGKCKHQELHSFLPRAFPCGSPAMQVWEGADGVIVLPAPRGICRMQPAQGVPFPHRPL